MVSSFQYIDSYKVAAMPGNSSNFESYELTANTDYEKHLGVAGHDLDASGLNGFSG